MAPWLAAAITYLNVFKDMWGVWHYDTTDSIAKLNCTNFTWRLPCNIHAHDWTTLSTSNYEELHETMSDTIWRQTLAPTDRMSSHFEFMEPVISVSWKYLCYDTSLTYCAELTVPNSLQNLKAVIYVVESSLQCHMTMSHNAKRLRCI